MQSHIHEWQAACDDKALFLNCYMLMSSSMLSAIQNGEFNDCPWVDRLLHRFADYYFAALEAYEADPSTAPAVWDRAHRMTSDPSMTAIQKMLMGINAHINYALVFTLVDMLSPEWADLSEAQRRARYADHCHVNDVIGRTIDAVQDEVLEPKMPIMDLFDRLMGPVDEMLISRLITRWRETVWTNATGLLAASDPDERDLLCRKVEADTLRMAEFICF
jgi:hypothetical protein